jgi:L-cystine uptake protein TcyP (sodium:dicarboxylate symporter family)
MELYAKCDGYASDPPGRTRATFGLMAVAAGATFAAILLLSTLNLPIALVGLLISVEPLIDMSRTAINVNGAPNGSTPIARTASSPTLSER